MNNKEYINKYKSLIDLIIIYYLKNNLFLDENEDTKKNLNIYFDNKYINDNDLIAIKHEIIDIYKEILSTEKTLEYKREIPIVFLFDIFKFSFFEKLGFLLGLFYIKDEKYRFIISCLDNINIYGVSVDLVLKIWSNLNIEEKLFNNHFDVLKYNILGLDSEKNQRKCFQQKIILISDKAQAFIDEINYIDEDIRYKLKYNNELDLESVILSNEIDRYINNLLNQDINKLNILVIKGKKGSGKKTQVGAISSRYNVKTVFININLIIGKNEKEIIKILNKIMIEVFLSKSILCFYNLKNYNESDIDFIFEYLSKFFSFIIVLTEDKMLNMSIFDSDKFLFNSFIIDDLSEHERLVFWKKFINDNKITDEDIEKMARGFVLNVGQIKDITLKYSMMKTDDYDYNINLLKNFCIESSNYNFGKLAFRVRYHTDWDDIVLEKDCKEKLQNICDRIKYKNKVYDDWNFLSKLPYGEGISALFYGPPGTGKTMAAKLIADQAGCELYKIDLSQVINKYVGETEKNLNDIFDKASKTNVILFFDEADSIFSKRTNVSSSNDKYSNLETSYLLQKIEEYKGISILATNFLSGFDEAFKRRIKFIVNFNVPNKDNRLLLWKKSFPKEVKISLDVDFLRIAEKYELTGSSIKSIALSAAFFAAKDDGVIEMKHIKAALKDELEKDGKIFLSNEFDIY